jgi:hypothetical protein
MRKTLVALVSAVLTVGPLATLASAGPDDPPPVIQPLHCQIGDRTGVYVGPKCNGGPY